MFLFSERNKLGGDSILINFNFKKAKGFVVKVPIRGTDNRHRGLADHEFHAAMEE